MKYDKLRGQSLALLSMLGIQFILGMLLNLFVALPKTHEGTSGSFASRSIHSFGWAISAGGGIILVLHVLVAIGLLFGSLALVARSFSAHATKAWLAVSIIGALGIITAFTNGLAFIGYNHNLNSFIMAIGFMVAATAYSYSLAFAANPATAKKTKTSKENLSPNVVGKFHHSHS